MHIAFAIDETTRCENDDAIPIWTPPANPSFKIPICFVNHACDKSQLCLTNALFSRTYF
jgi:hypothetical protein